MKTLKEQMEEIWARPGVQSAIHPAQWRLAVHGTRLVIDYSPRQTPVTPQ
jgi:hypothetical protein